MGNSSSNQNNEIRRICSSTVILSSNIISYTNNKNIYKINNYHCLSPNKRFLLAYSLEYIKLWDLGQINKNQNVGISIDLNMLLYDNIYSDLDKSNNKDSIFLNQKLICASFKSNNELIIAFLRYCDDKSRLDETTGYPKVILVSIILSEEKFGIFEIKNNDSFYTLNEDCPILMKLSTTTEYLALYGSDGITIYDTSKKRCLTAAPFGDKTFQYEFNRQLGVYKVEIEKSKIVSIEHDPLIYFSSFDELVACSATKGIYYNKIRYVISKWGINKGF